MVDISALLKERSGIRLDIGGGDAPQAGFINLDIRPLPTVDIVWDFLQFPWPLPDDICLMAMASHVVEHIPPCVIDNGRTRWPFIEFMDEAWRVLKVGAEFAISMPYGYSPSYMQDPTHCNAINETRWAYFDPAEPNTAGNLWTIYKPKPWKLKFLSWAPDANIEVIMCKRALDPLTWEPRQVKYE